jgi:Ser/Thr protein kinase RdoA (MazF antagonist)
VAIPPACTALLVEHVAGRPARLPQDLPALARALASLHRLPVPDQRAPLMAPADPLADLLAEVDRQAAFLDGPVDPVSRAAIEAERRSLQPLLARPGRPPVCLVSFDAHPGNFVVRPDGQAVLVDLEKCRYGHAGIDLAHATLYTSTTWDESTRSILSDADVQAFIEVWERSAGLLAAPCRPWHLPLRRAMWLWSVTWCAKWRVLSQRAPAADGEDWSSRHSREALVAHVRERVDHYLDPQVVASVRDGLHRLEQRLGP